MIKDSFIDNGKTVDEDFNLVGINFKQNLAKMDSDGDDLFVASDAKMSQWQVNQQSICFNLPALAMFIS